MKRGVLLINLGTPTSPDIPSVKKYLKQFLSDPRVIDIPAFFRFLLVNFIIIPFRSKKSSEAYRLIWTASGSPLLTNSKNLLNKIQDINPDYLITLGMRYGNPSIAEALNQLKSCHSITIIPLYPQYSSAATGSSIEECINIVKTWNNIPSLKILNHFYQHPQYIEAQSYLIAKHLEDYFLLFSYHGIPERQILKSGCKSICKEDCNKNNNANTACYRFQCYKTSELLALQLGINPINYDTAFQSRLGKTPWIKPYTDKKLNELAERGIKKLAIVCPSFVADCLETLEEIELRAHEQWTSLGGEHFKFIPSLNDNPAWAHALSKIIGTLQRDLEQ